MPGEPHIQHRRRRHGLSAHGDRHWALHPAVHKSTFIHAIDATFLDHKNFEGYNDRFAVTNPNISARRSRCLYSTDL